MYFVKGKNKEKRIILQSDTLSRVYNEYIRNGEFLDYCGLFANGMASARGFKGTVPALVDSN